MLLLLYLAGYMCVGHLFSWAYTQTPLIRKMIKENGSDPDFIFGLQLNCVTIMISWPITIPLFLLTIRYPKIFADSYQKTANKIGYIVAFSLGVIMGIILIIKNKRQK